MNNFNSGRLAGFFTPYRRFSNKLPSLYLDHRFNPDDPYSLEIYFVNNSGFVLDWVELINPLLDEFNGIFDTSKRYLSVEPDEAVVVAQFDEVYSSDTLHQLIILWKAAGEPVKEVRILGKGTTKFRYKVLEWLPDAP